MCRTARKTAFDSEARLYAEIRPRYPEPLFDALIEAARFPRDASLLEIGPGTGQATFSFAQRGYQIIAVELGKDLARAARRELKGFPNAKIIIDAFERVVLPPESFDLVYAATAFHWIDPEVKFVKPHRLLKNRGCLAIIHANDVIARGDDGFFRASQPIYAKYQDERAGRTHSSSAFSNMADVKPDTMDENLFTPVLFELFPMTVEYSAEEYCKLLNTYSPTLIMRPQQRESFLGELRDLILTKFKGTIRKHYAMSLTIGRKR